MDEILLESPRYIFLSNDDQNKNKLEFYEYLSKYKINSDIKDIKDINKIPTECFIKTEIKNFEINKEKKYIRIRNNSINCMLYSIKTENEIDKVYVLLDDGIIQQLAPEHIKYINGEYILNGEYGLCLYFYSELNVIITFKNISDNIVVNCGICDIFKSNKINIFQQLLNIFDIRKLYGFPYKPNTYDSLEKINFLIE